MPRDTPPPTAPSRRVADHLRIRERQGSGSDGPRGSGGPLRRLADPEIRSGTPCACATVRRVAEDARIREGWNDAMTVPVVPEGVADARRIVVKVGSSSISGDRAAQVGPLVVALAAAHARGVEVVLVSSGAIATGLPYLRLAKRPTDLAVQQAAAAVGQSLLIRRYQERLDAFGITAGQVLLTAGDIDDPAHRRNAERALETLLELRILPIVNENDTVATHEIRFGDNDRLAALVARLIGADLLVLLSDVDALYTRPPEEPGAVRIPFVAAGDPLDEVRATATATGVGTGGAATKLTAARMAAEAGVAVLLTATDLVEQALTGERVGTWFEPAPHPAAPPGDRLGPAVRGRRPVR